LAGIAGEALETLNKLLTAGFAPAGVDKTRNSPADPAIVHWRGSP
jgi:hypothetical protein